LRAPGPARPARTAPRHDGVVLHAPLSRGDQQRQPPRGRRGPAGSGLRGGAAALGAWVTSRRGITLRATCTTGKGFGGLRRRTVQRLIDREARNNNATQRTTHQQGVGLAMQPVTMQQQTARRRSKTSVSILFTRRPSGHEERLRQYYGGVVSC